MDLGKYHIFEEIGHGGFGTVYRANDTTLDRIVALKVLHEQYLSDQKFIESFKREARMMARVSHPNVVQLFEVGDLNGQIYIAMQYFDAGNLDQKIQAGGPLPLKDAIRMLSQTARGLEAGHKIGLVHRDVKPANILYNREGYIAISDFSVAKSIQQSSPETTNSFNQFAGTPYYIPPELWKSEGNPSPAADVYSLACVFYEALTGEILFTGNTYEHVLTRHVLEAPVFSKALPECLVDTLNIALAKNPSDRYQTMNDFLAAVRGALEGQARTPARSETSSEQTSVIEDLPKPLASGEITFEELVRRSQHKTTSQSPVTKPAPVLPVIPTAQPQTQQQPEEAKAKPQILADATTELTASPSDVTIAESNLEGEVVVEPISEMPQEARSVTPAEDRYAQALKQREGSLAHNEATSRFDQSKDKTAKKEPAKKPLLLLLLALGGIAVIAFAFLLFSGRIGNLFGGKPSATPPEAVVVVEPPVVEGPTEAPPEAPIVVETPMVEQAAEAQIETPTPFAYIEGTTLRIWADEQRAPVLTELGTEFQAKYNVEVVVENISGIRDQFLVAAPAGEGPDIIVIAHDQLPTLITSGLVAEINLGAKAAEFDPETLKAFSYSGKQYGMPYARENLGFFYNADLVTEVPTTWQVVYALSKELMDAGKVQYGIVLAGSSYDAYPWMTSQGGYIFGQDANGNYVPSDLGVGGEGMIKFGEMALQWKNDGVLSENLDNTTAKSMFLNGDVAFIMNGPWEINNLKTSGLNFGIAKFPDGGYPFLHVQGFAVNSLSENILLAQTFLTEFVATEDAMLALYNADPRGSAYLPAAAKIDDPFLNAIAKAGEGAKPMPGIPEMGAVWFDWGNALTFIFNGEKTPEQAYTDAAANIQLAIASKGMVNLPGSWQAAAGYCDSDWDPKCPATALSLGVDGLYTGIFTIPAGDYELKVAHDGGWAINYGVDGIADGDNIRFSIDREVIVKFVYDPKTHFLDLQAP